MKIGILTFHWATNYGAVLQCYALQEFLHEQGYEVEIINYKPIQYEETFYNFLRKCKFLHLSSFLVTYRQERALNLFRKKFLHLTQRVISCRNLYKIVKHYDVIISGSDQVTNPTFLMCGEGKGIVTPTYFIGFPFKGKRVGYALSFGCIAYPEQARKVAIQYIKNFDAISVREKSGADIVKSMGRDDVVVVPDPTFLMQPPFYHNLTDRSLILRKKPFIYSFFIRHIVERKSIVNSLFKNKKILWNCEDGNYAMQDWLAKIKYADFVITDSFHCVVMCLKLHTPFVVVTENEGNVGMNDRLFTMLSIIEMESRILHKSKMSKVHSVLANEIQWGQIDKKLDSIRKKGTKFLQSI